MTRNRTKNIVVAVIATWAILLAVSKSLSADSRAEYAADVASEADWKVRELESEIERLERELRYR